MDQKRRDEFNLSNFAALNDKRKDIQKCITIIMNTLSFRKLAGKTQVILSLAGPDVRTRLTHTIEVAKIAKDICIALELNKDLAEAMALAHDIGHTPFGHVGERTLREIMCGCDTLKDKVRDCDFCNSGFKHNLQSFRILKELEDVETNSNIQNEIWEHIFWGALAHTKMTYAKAYSGMEDEILISSKHCDWVYVCFYDNNKECKRNIQKKKLKGANNKEICKPWFCAVLPLIVDRNKVNKDFLVNNETTREYIKKEPIEEKYLPWIYCSHKCYMARLWEYKAKHKEILMKFPYLFDHPFPNSFYANSLYSYFKQKDKYESGDFISFEAQIVRQADEIAQRQQDLEDGINKGLLSFENAIEDVEFLIEEFNHNDTFRDELEGLKDIKNANNLGKLLADFYKKSLIEQTKANVYRFINDQKKVKINIYSLLNILYLMDNENSNSPNWILEELKIHKKIQWDLKKIDWIENYFELDYNSSYLFLFTYDYLVQRTKTNEYTNSTKNILCQWLLLVENELLHRIEEENEDLCEVGIITSYKQIIDLTISINKDYIDPLKFQYVFLKTLDFLRKYMFKHYKDECIEYFFKRKKDVWKNIGMLKLSSCYILIKVIEEKKKNKMDIINTSNLNKLKVQVDYDPKIHSHEAYVKWKMILKSDANKVLSNLVDFVNEEIDACENRINALEIFEDSQKNNILKSEIVEKNDGKASYMLKRMFKAYITSPHQLPDLGLKYILTSLNDSEIKKQLISSEKNTFKEIADKLEKTMLKETLVIDDVKRISETNLFEFKVDDLEFKKMKIGKSNEFVAALENRRKLSYFIGELEKDQKKIQDDLNSEIVDPEQNNGKSFIRNKIRNLRAILDNPILNATPRWKSILTRGICDYIASLTDQEAINEYEKLYAGIMELV